MRLQTKKISFVLIGGLLLTIVLPAYCENEGQANQPMDPKQIHAASKAAAPSSGGMGGQAADPGSGYAGMMGGGMGMGGGMMGGYSAGMAISAQAESSSVLIIPSGQKDSEAIDEIMEDGKIMSQIISEAIPPAQGQSPFKGYIGSALYDVFGSAGQISCLYIEQYGMIFVRQVDYPLLPFEKVEYQPQQDKDTDKVWQKAKRTVQGETVSDEDEQDIKSSYDPVRVEQLKQNLIGSLKHASNIRRLPAEEYIVIAIRYNAPPRRDSYPKRPVLLDLSQESQPARPQSSSMIVRAAKKDIDQFADEEIDDAEFKKRVEVIIY